MAPTPNIGTYSIDSLQQELEGMMHGTTLNQIENIFGAWDRAARRLLGDVDPQETKIVSQFGKVYDGVWDYPFATDVKGNRLADLFPQANRKPWEKFNQSYNQTFDRYKDFSLVPDFTPRYAGAVRTIRIAAKGLQTGISVNNANGYNTDGVWTAGANVSDVTTNNQYMVDGGTGSVQFNIDQTGVPASVAIISNPTMDAVDLTNHYNNADEFFSIYMPNADGISSVRYIFGSDTTGATDYFDSGEITEQYMGYGFQDGWNSIAEGWADFAIVGSPDVASIQYMEIRITYDGTIQTQVLLNQFWSRLGVIFNQEYYSKYLFRDATTGEFKEKVTDESDFVNLDTDAVNGLLYAMLGMAAQQVQGADALFFDANEAEQKYVDWLAGYKMKYRSEVIKPIASYYRKPNASYRRFFGRRWGGVN